MGIFFCFDPTVSFDSETIVENLMHITCAHFLCEVDKWNMIRIYNCVGRWCLLQLEDAAEIFKTCLPKTGPVRFGSYFMTLLLPNRKRKTKYFLAAVMCVRYAASREFAFPNAVWMLFDHSSNIIGYLVWRCRKIPKILDVDIKCTPLCVFAHQNGDPPAHEWMCTTFFFLTVREQQ